MKYLTTINHVIMFRYQKDFKEFIAYCEDKFQGPESEHLGGSFVIGGGNPEGHILFLGAEPSNEANGYNTLRSIKEDLEKEKSFIRNKRSIGESNKNYWGRWRTQTVWYNYQRLYDYIQYGYVRNHDDEIDFEDNVFCTELSGIPKKHSSLSTDTKASLDMRKKWFFTHKFFDRFDVIVINNKSGYIRNDSVIPEEREIDRIFKVEYKFKRTNEKRTNTFWVHKGNIKGHPRILIHTRNLSYGVSQLLLEEMGKVIRDFLKSCRTISGNF